MKKEERGAITFYGNKEKHSRIMTYVKLKEGISFNTYLRGYIDRFFTTNEIEIVSLEEKLDQLWFDDEEEKKRL